MTQDVPGCNSTVVILLPSHASPSGEDRRNSDSRQFFDCADSADAGGVRGFVGVLSISHLAQISVNELDRDGTFAHARSDAFDRAMTDVSDRKNPGHVRFEKTLDRDRAANLLVAFRHASDRDQSVQIREHRAPRRRPANQYAVRLR